MAFRAPTQLAVHPLVAQEPATQANARRQVSRNKIKSYSVRDVPGLLGRLVHERDVLNYPGNVFKFGRRRRLVHKIPGRRHFVFLICGSTAKITVKSQREAVSISRSEWPAKNRGDRRLPKLPLQRGLPRATRDRSVPCSASRGSATSSQQRDRAASPPATCCRTTTSVLRRRISAPQIAASPCEGCPTMWEASWAPSSREDAKSSSPLALHAGYGDRLARRATGQQTSQHGAT